MTGTALAELTTEGIRSGLVRGETSADALTRAHLNRIASVDAVLNSIVTTAGDAALQRAHELDADFAAYRRFAGPLHGVPVVVKDELGGKNTLIVFADADLDAAARGIVEGGFFNQGEACTAASRALVQRDVYDEVVQRVGEAVARLVVGNGVDPRTHVSGTAETGSGLPPHWSGGRGTDRRSSRPPNRPGVG